MLGGRKGPRDPFLKVFCKLCKLLCLHLSGGLQTRALSTVLSAFGIESLKFQVAPEGVLFPGISLLPFQRRFLPFLDPGKKSTFFILLVLS